MDARFRRLAVVTTALTYLLVLLGLYTGATGGGLSCGANWPLCDGAVFGLFPANWASFFEWSHRLVAMVVGFLLLGTLYGAWRWQTDRRVSWAVTGAILLLPIQVGLGAVTTTAGGVFPRGFNPVVMVTHFTTAAAIFGLLVAATLLANPVPNRSRLRGFLASIGCLVALGAVFGSTGLVPFYPRYQVVYYGASYALFGGFVALAVWVLVHTEPPAPRAVGYAGGVGALAAFFDMVLSRQLFGIDPVASHAATLLAAAALGWAVWALARGRVPEPAAPSGD
ncbi:MAG: COX15/CtaA family protein [Haloarculaceae archaeon]